MKFVKDTKPAIQPIFVKFDENFLSVDQHSANHGKQTGRAGRFHFLADGANSGGFEMPRSSAAAPLLFCRELD
ncbi:hypothetical protein FJ546_00415 [Mesorhizobium sp. B2-4-19]|uniref:hypothetical protein n=1 Tax=Mesorhizobium sp. B2-4-19 TaxID=2589930 RepID=UPI00112C8F0C|nr:hypothetical protein [Mesorhizobium sp. B2-4-19]TPK69114.1 hypothetical protein FJ546_00415 [Mesorhizobium sp. B2-4-19]